MMGSMMRRAMLGDGSTLSLDFTQMSTLADLTSRGLTFSRSTSGTYINASGLVATATAGNPRFDYDTSGNPRGILLEGSATNLVYHSETLRLTAVATEPYWADSASISRGNDTAPDGTANAAVNFVAIGTAGTVIQTAAVGTSANRTFSFWARRTGGGTVEYTLDNGSTWIAVTITANWVRYTATATNANQRVGFRVAIGAGTSIWGAQLEAGAGSSSYIPTAASTGNRAEDTCYMDGTNFSSWYSASTQTGTLFADITHSALSNTNGGIELGNGLGSQTSSNRVSLRRDGVIVDGVSAITVSPTGASQRFKTAIAFAPGTSNTAACRNGGTVSNPAQAAGTLSGINALKFYIDASPSLRPYGWVRQVKVWPTNLANATLQAITTL